MRLQSAVAGRYRVQREIGHGGMGMVYLAHDLRHGRSVAIKVLRPELASSLGGERFLREIQTAAQLTHPHILPLHDSEEAEGLLYYIMPYVEGESLRERLERERQLPVPLAVSLTRQVADALAYAHAHGIVHRDIKPENILLLENDQAMLADFGLARAIASAANRPLTPTGLVIGSPLYMSPEQAAGERKLDGRADIYSLGCVLFEMLTGAPPFRGPNARVIARRKITESPPSVRSERPEVPVALERVVRKAMATAPEARYQEVAQFSVELERAVGARSWFPGWMWIAAGTAAMVLVGIAGYWLLRPPPMPLGPRPQVLVADFQGQGVEPELAHAIATALRADLSQSRFVRVIEPRQIRSALQRMQWTEGTSLDLARAREVALREGFEGIIGGEVSRVGTGYVLVAQLVDTGSEHTLVALRETARDSSELYRAIDRLSEQLRARIGESARSIRSSEPLEQVTTASLDALRKYSQAVRAMFYEGDYDRAITLLEEAIELDPGFAAAYRALGTAYSNQGGQWSRALSMFEKAYEHRDRLPEPERYMATGIYFTALGERERAISTYRILLDIQPDHSGALNNLGFIYQRMGDFARAEHYYARAHAVSSSALSLSNLLEAQFDLGKLEEARTTFERFSRQFPEHPRRSYNAGHMAAAMGDYPAAEAHFLELRRTHGEDAVARIDASQGLGALAALQGKLNEAERHAQSVIQDEQRRGSSAGPLEAVITLALLDVHARRAPERAIARVEEALAARPLDSIPIDDRPYVALVGLYADAGSMERARALIEQHREAMDPRQARIIEREQRSMRAALATAEGRGGEAVEELRARGPSYCPTCDLLLLARAFEQAAQQDSAVAVYERYLSVPYIERLFSDQVWLPFAYQRLAELYEQAGNAERAAFYYRRWLDLWHDADALLQPRLLEVRQRLEQLDRAATTALRSASPFHPRGHSHERRTRAAA